MKLLLEPYPRISLEEMAAVKLMNRIDTKYVAPMDKMCLLLQMAAPEYRVQDIGGEVNLPYFTQYFDTPEYAMYMAHLHGRKDRQKIRIRRYESSDLQFLEVKHKGNTGRTDKRRVDCRQLDDVGRDAFLNRCAHYRYADLQPALENRFCRVTLVNRALTERVTIDTALRVHNCHTDQCCRVQNLAVIELKRDGHCPSPLLEMLRTLRIFPASFSKYCLGMAVTDESLKHNNFKPQLHTLQKGQHLVGCDMNSF
jgi:hypothetical protein